MIISYCVCWKGEGQLFICVHFEGGGVVFL